MEEINGGKSNKTVIVLSMVIVCIFVLTVWIVYFGSENSYSQDSPEILFGDYYKAINNDDRVDVINLHIDKFSPDYEQYVHTEDAWGWVYYLHVDVHLIKEIDKANISTNETESILLNINSTEISYDIQIEDYSLVQHTLVVTNALSGETNQIELRKACYQVDSLWYMSHIEFVV